VLGDSRVYRASGHLCEELGERSSRTHGPSTGGRSSIRRRARRRQPSCRCCPRPVRLRRSCARSRRRPRGSSPSAHHGLCGRGWETPPSRSPPDRLAVRRRSGCRAAEPLEAMRCSISVQGPDWRPSARVTARLGGLVAALGLDRRAVADELGERGRDRRPTDAGRLATSPAVLASAVMASRMRRRF
jgi:hypothetical protein